MNDTPVEKTCAGNGCQCNKEKPIVITQPEKRVEIITSSHAILSELARWGIRQSPYDFPKNLEKALQAASENMIQWGYFPVEKKQQNSYKRFTEVELVALIDRVVKQTPEIAIWNVTQVEQDAGITDPEDPKRSVRHAFASIHGSHQRADRDFIDLDAMVRNIVNSID